MPWGLTRFHHSGQSHFVTFCCYHRHRLFTADASCRIFESALERVRRSYRLYVYGYVVMPEHVHLLLSEPRQDTLADALKSLTQAVSRRLIPKMGGPLKPAFGLSGPPASPERKLRGHRCIALLQVQLRDDLSPWRKTAVGNVRDNNAAGV